MHPTDGELFLSSEPSAEAGNVLAHVAACAVCSARFQTLQREIEHATSALERLDGPVPDVSARALIERATREKVERGRAEGPSQRRFPARAAAVAALLVIAGAAAAMPGSPVRRWTERRFGNGDAPPAPETVRTAPPSDGFGGVALPADVPLEVVLPLTVANGQVILLVTAEDLVRVRSSDPTTGFSVGPSILTLTTSADSLGLEITAPASMPRLVVRMADRVVFSQDRPFGPAALLPGDTLRIPLALSRP